MTPVWTTPALVRWLAGVAPVTPPLSAEADWRQLADRCRSLRILPQMFQRLGSPQAIVSAADVPEFLHRRMHAIADTGRVLHGGCRALRALDAAGISAAAFKGMAAVGWLHGGQPSRGVGDVDVLVAPARARAALDVLAAAGFRSKVADVTAEAVVRFARRSPGSAGNEAISLVSDDGAEVDLHWRIGACDVASALAEARGVRVLNDQVRVVRPGLGLLLSVHHALRNDFVPDAIVRDLIDAAGWFAWLEADAAERAWVDQTARRMGLDVALDAVAAVLGDLGVGTGRVVPAADAPARALADLFQVQTESESGAINTDLVYLCSARPWWTILNGLVTSGPGYLRTMRAVEAANGATPMPLVERLRRLIADARRAPGSRWRGLRVLAASKNRVA